MGLPTTHPGATGLSFFCHNGDHLTQPPPAHMGIPPYQLDPKTAAGAAMGAMGAMGDYWRVQLGLRASPAAGNGAPGTSPPPPPPPAVGLSTGDWKRLGPLLAATGKRL